MNRLCSAVQKSLIPHRGRGEQILMAYFASTSRPGQVAQKPGTERTAAMKRTKLVTPKITLICQKQISITSLEEAQKLAKRRDLRIIQLQKLDSKTQRPVYKLVTAAEMIAQELEELQSDEKDKNVQKKSDKSLTIGGRISEHDLASRLKNIAKWLAKRHEVRVLIQGNAVDMSSSDKIVKAIEQSIVEPEVIGKIVQKRNKGAVIKFNVIPVTTTTTTVANDNAAPPA